MHQRYLNRIGVYHNFVVQVDGRADLMSSLAKRGVATKIHYPIPLHLQKAAENLKYKRGDFPVAERQSERIMSLPIYPELTDSEIEYVVKSIKELR